MTISTRWLAVLAVLFLAAWPGCQSRTPDVPAVVSEPAMLVRPQKPDRFRKIILPQADTQDVIVLRADEDAEVRLSDPALPEMVSDVKVESKLPFRWSQAKAQDFADGHILMGGGHVKVIVTPLGEGTQTVKIDWKQGGQTHTLSLRFLVK